MPRGLFIPQPEAVEIREYDDPPLKLDQVRLQTEFAAIKHGTLFHLFSGKSPFAHRRFDLEQRLFVPVAEDASFVGSFMGDMAVGTITDVGPEVSGFRPGDRVYAYGPVCETLTKAETEIRPVVPPLTAQDVVCQDPALFAYAALRDARIRLGDNVLVFGLGAIGLMLIQMLKRTGCLHIVAVDLYEKRRQLASQFGADLVLDPSQTDVAVAVREYLGQGADIVVEASGNYRALHEAMRAARQCARIVTLGYYKGVDNVLELGSEFFHNQLELVACLPAWNNPSREYPIWDLERLTNTVLALSTRGWITSAGIVDPVVPFEDAAQTFMDIYRNPSDAIKLGIEFGMTRNSTAQT